MPDPVISSAWLALQHAQTSRIGGRDTNEDALGCVFSGDAACFVVSDGVGGHEGGEVASVAVVEAVQESFQAYPSPSSEVLRSHIEYAAASVAQCKKGNKALANMSATAAALIIDPDARRALWAHVGDTRIYMLRNGRVHRVTRDHSLVQQLVDAGYCTAEQAKAHPLRNTLLFAIGANSEEPLDITCDETGILEGDAFLVCTDGLWEWLSNEEIEHLLALSLTAEQWLGELVRVSEENCRGSGKLRDNYTAFAVIIDGAE